MAIMIKALAIAMVVMLIDAIIQHITGGGIALQGDTYTFVELIFLFFQVIITFIGIIVHAITHLDKIPDDLMLLVNGLFVVVLFAAESIIDMWWHILNFPFDLLGMALDQFRLPNGKIMGAGLKLSMDAIGGILIDIRTLTFQIQIGDIDGLDLFGVKIYVKNTIGFSIFGNSDYPVMRDVLGDTYEWYKTGMGGFSIALDFKDGVEACFPDLVEMAVCITENLPPFRNPLDCLDASSDKFKCHEISFIIETPETLKSISFWNLLRDVIDALPIPKLANWISDTWKALGFAITVDSSSIQFIRFKLEKVIYSCQAKSLMV